LDPCIVGFGKRDFENLLVEKEKNVKLKKISEKKEKELIDLNSDFSLLKKKKFNY